MQYKKKPGEKSVKIYPIILLILKLILEILKCVAKETCVVGIFLKKLNTLINEKNTNLKWETKKNLMNNFNFLNNNKRASKKAVCLKKSAQERINVKNLETKIILIAGIFYQQNCENAVC